MCDSCEEARGPVAEEVVRRTGATLQIVMDVLKALEDMTFEAVEKKERETAIETLAGLIGEGGRETIAAMIADGRIEVLEISADGTPAPAPAHSIDRPSKRYEDVPLPGMYL